MGWLTRTVKVRAYHNVAGDQGEPYKPGDVLVPVAAWDVPAGQDPLCVAEGVYELLNVGDDPDLGTPDKRLRAIAVEYRERGNRSVSLGDVVCIGEEWFAVARGGFTRVEKEPGLFSLVPLWPGSSPMDLG
jgi:predicted RecA/RadA family phage recombinase